MRDLKHLGSPDPEEKLNELRLVMWLVIAFCAGALAALSATRPDTEEVIDRRLSARIQDLQCQPRDTRDHDAPVSTAPVRRMSA